MSNIKFVDITLNDDGEVTITDGAQTQGVAVDEFAKNTEWMKPRLWGVVQFKCGCEALLDQTHKIRLARRCGGSISEVDKGMDFYMDNVLMMGPFSKGDAPELQVEGEVYRRFLSGEDVWPMVVSHRLYDADDKEKFNQIDAHAHGFNFPRCH